MGRAGSGIGPRLGTRYVSVGELRGVQVIHDVSPNAARNDELRRESLRKLFDRGASAVARNAGPVVVGVSPTGKTEIFSGRHRIDVFREPKYREGRLLVRFVRMVD